MPFDEGNPRLTYRGNAVSRVKDWVLKVVAAVAGVAVLAGAFVLSLAFFAIGLAVVIIVGGYFWWKTRRIRRELRAQMQQQRTVYDEPARDDVIEGVVLSRKEESDDR
jgi:uncharacterized iron-regulated membrane protein